jgi:hypothetical protein
MGCDIHMFAEKKVNDKWEKIGKVFPNPYYRPNEESKIEEDGYEWNPKFTDTPYRGRNYDLFAILADVRNGYGFAGIPTGEGFVPISEPKGLPNNVSKEIEDESDGWGGDGHSHSWFTLKEIKDYDWNQTTKSYGVISLDQYKEFKKTGIPPESYSSMISGPNIKVVSAEEMDKIVEENSHEQGIQYHVHVVWGTTYKDSVGSFFFEKTLKHLEEQGSDDNVRIVFWFDN